MIVESWLGFSEHRGTIVLRKYRRSNEEHHKLNQILFRLISKTNCKRGIASSYSGIKKTRQVLEDAKLPPTD